MGNIEVRFRNDQAYLLKTHNKSVEKFENLISSFKCSETYEKYKNSKDEYGVEKDQFPAVNIVFYEHIFSTSQVIPPQDFVNIYLNYYGSLFEHADDQIEYCGKIYNAADFAGRILRTYPSLIRDFDFY